MKKFFILLFAALLFTFCSKKEDPKPEEDAPADIYVKIDGQGYGFVEPVALVDGKDLRITNKYNDIFIKINNFYETPGTYTLSNSSYGIFYKGFVKHRTESGYPGSITITEYNTQKKTISGTFSFVATNTSYTSAIVATEGTITNVPFITKADLPVTTEYLNYTLDGVEYKYKNTSNIGYGASCLSSGSVAQNNAAVVNLNGLVDIYFYDLVQGRSGTFYSGSTSSYLEYYWDNNWATSGDYSITEYSTTPLYQRLTGTFSGSKTGSGAFTVTDGSFSVIAPTDLYD